MSDPEGDVQDSSDSAESSDSVESSDSARPSDSVNSSDAQDSPTAQESLDSPDGRESLNSPDGQESPSDSASIDEKSTRPADADDEASCGPHEATTTGGDTARAVARQTADDVDIDELTGPARRLEARVRVVWAIRGGVVAAIVGLLVGIAALVPGSPVGLEAAPVAFVGVFALAVVHAWLRYRSWCYRVREDSLYLERGVLTMVKTVVPYVRIQHVDARRRPLERALGLASVVVYTAGSRGADVTIPGLTPDRADDLQTRLERLAIAAGGEDAV